MVAGVISSPANARTSLTAPRHAAAGPPSLLKVKNVKRREKMKKNDKIYSKTPNTDQSVTSRLETSLYRDFSRFFESIGLGLKKKSRYRSRKYLV